MGPGSDLRLRGKCNMIRHKCEAPGTRVGDGSSPPAASTSRDMGSLDGL